ncbi:MAG: EAL domain-containing protein [Pseudomonadota bacterium]|nr:EAL domain-containing protein [Pseudomonadota bacterium]
MSEAGAPAILIVDDEAVNLRLMEALLKPEGYRTSCAASGEQALAMVAERKPDLILLDIMMPGMNGYQVATALKANALTANIPIIMLTALVDRGARMEGLRAGAEEFLTKPVDRTELWLRVRNLLRLKAYGDLLQRQGDILEQKVRARTAELQRFRSAMDATAEAIFLVQRSSMLFVEVNTTACEMLGYTREELLRIGPRQIGMLSAEDIASIDDPTQEGPRAKKITEIQVERKDGSQLAVEVHRQAHFFDDEWIIVGVLRDISERKQAEQRLHHMAHYDALTSLPNRLLFYETLKKTLAMASDADSSWQVAVMFIDLDRFKDVNDTLGHAVGDALLVEVGDRLLQCVRVRDTVGRLGGDEFALIMVAHGIQQGAGMVAAKVGEALRAPFLVHGHKLSVSASIGITIHPDDASDPDTLIRYADTAMYRAKHAGRDTFCFFTAQMNTDVLARLELERALRDAVEREEFVLHYQPKVALDSGRITGVEALLRWNRPGHGLVMPHSFVGVLEEIGLIVPVGAWVIATACRQIGAWIAAAIVPVQMSVNVSRRQFIEGNLEADVIAALSEHRIAAGLLDLELTEGSLMDNTDRTIDTLRNLKKLGVQVSIDDFGTGYSSLAYLRSFPIDTLKIDIAFIREVTSNPDDAAITCAIIGMAHHLRLDVVAEGVETAAQLAYLRRQRCDHIQGHFFSEALPAAELDLLLRDNKRMCALDSELLADYKTVLLVDEDDGVRVALTALLRPDGYRILVAGSASEAFELLALHQVQVIVCEQLTAGISGTALCDCVKDMYPDTYRIVVSGQSDLATIMAAVNRGAVDRFYTKPWHDVTLRTSVRDAFRQHARVHGTVSMALSD